jgi:hypothetical protein
MLPAMAKPRFTTRVTIRLQPSLLADLEREAHAKGDDLSELARDILAAHTSRRSVERRQEAERQ